MTKYNSHIKNLRITIAPATPIFEGGQKVGDKQGKYATFTNGQFETDDKEIIEKLESLPTYNVDFWRASDKKKTDEPEKTETDQTTPDGQNDEIKLENMTKKELVLLAKEKDVQVNDKQTKEEIINLLKAKANQ